MRNKILLLFLTLFFNSYAQTIDWQNFTGGGEIRDIVEQGDLLWIATDGLVRINRATSEKTIFTHGNSQLPMNYVTSVAVDAAGTVWAGTYGGGLVRYDGSAFTIYTEANSDLASDYINALAVDANNLVVIGTVGSGLVTFDGTIFTTYNTGNSGIPDNRILSVDVDLANGLWVGTFGQGCARFDGSAWTVYNSSNSTLPDNYVFSIAHDQYENIWVGTTAGVASYNSQAWIVYNTANSQLPNNYVHSVFVDQYNFVWAGTNGGVAMFSGTGWSIYNTANTGLPNESVLSVLYDSQGRLYSGTDGSGLFIYAYQTWVKIETGNSGLPSGMLYEVVSDGSSTIYSATNNGYSLFDGTTWTMFNKQNSDIPGNNVNALVVQDANVTWAGTTEGLAKHIGTRWLIYSPLNSGMPAADVRSLELAPNGTLWIGTNGGGLVAYDGTTWTVYNAANSPLPSNSVFELACDANGVIYAGTAFGLARFDGTNWTVFTQSNSDLPNNQISALAFTSTGNLLAGTRGGGFAEYDGTAWTVFNVTNSGIADDNITTLAVDNDGSIWVGTLRGLSYITQYDVTSYYSFNSGLPFNTVSSIAVDNNNFIWIGTAGGGLARFNPPDLPTSFITLTSPNGGEVWQAGTTQNITWTVDNVKSLKLDYSTDNGTTWNSIIASAPTAAGFYPWTVPATPSAQCLVRASSAANLQVSDVSDASFTIDPAVASLTLTAPNGGEVWLVGTQQNITWTQENAANVKLEYSADNGTSWNEIIASTPASAGTYGWTVPAAPSAQCFVRISDTGNPQIADNSNAVFTISQPQHSLSLTAPNGGEVWQEGSLQTITWNQANITYVGIDYSTDNGTTWNTVAASVLASLGLYEWTVPATPSAQCLVRVSDLGDPLNMHDQSDAVFTISQIGHSLTLTSPNGGEVWQAGSQQNITFTSETVEAVDLYFSAGNGTDISDGAEWILIAQNVSAAAGSYAWTVPNKPSQIVRVRITERGGTLVDESDAVFSIISNTPDISQNYPNPFNPSTTFSFSLPAAQRVSLHIISVTGETAAVLLDQVELSEGYHTVRFIAGSLPSGIYFYRFTSGETVITKKMLLLK